MSKQWFWPKAIGVLILIGLLIVGGLAIHYFAWSQGFKMGQLVTGGESSVAAHFGPYSFGGSGLLVTVAVILLLLMIVGKFFRMLAWSAFAGPWMMAHHAEWKRGSAGERWARHWHRRHGPVPPWCWDWEEPAEEAGTQSQATDSAES
jgi:hypothetical protein